MRNKAIDKLLFFFSFVDRKLLFIVLALALWGIINLLSVASYESEVLFNSPHSFFLQQIGTLLLAACLMVVVSMLNYQYWRYLGPLLGIFSIVALFLVNFSPLGVEAGGSERWLNLGVATIQPSEIAKLAIITLMADGLTRGPWYSPPVMARLVICGLIVLLTLIEPDLGSAIQMASYCGVLLLISGMNLLFAALVAGGAGLVVWTIIMNIPYQKQRFETWLSPESDPVGNGYNLMQSYYAIAEGGFWGSGYGNSFYKLGYLPVSYADFIFPIICEEFGFIGALLIVALYILFLFRGMTISLGAPDNFGRLLGIGIVFSIIIQAVLNLGGVTGIMPITGVPLPLISYGKTSLLSLAMMIGILFSISRQRNLLIQKKSLNLA